MPAGYSIALDALPGEASGGLIEPPLSPPVGLSVAQPITYGTFTALQPARSPATGAGYPIRDWQPDYLDRIIITIDNANFGTIAGVSDRTITIWNRYSTAKSVSAQGAVGASGVSILGFPALPFDLLATQEAAWTLRAGADGEPVIAGYLTFTIGGIALRTVDLSGIRVVVFPHLANWKTPPELARGYDDSIGEAISLAEERQGRGATALVGTRFQVLAMDRHEHKALALTLKRARALPVGMPLWSEFVRTTATAAAGATSVAVEAVGKRLFTTERPYALLWQAWDQWEIVTLAAVAANALTTSSPLLGTWPAGTLVAPVRFGKLALDGEQAPLTSKTRRFAVDFQEVQL